jgi:hypothetical protein
MHFGVNLSEINMFVKEREGSGRKVSWGGIGREAEGNDLPF